MYNIKALIFVQGNTKTLQKKLQPTKCIDQYNNINIIQTYIVQIINTKFQSYINVIVYRDVSLE